MPTYEYECKECNGVFEEFQQMTANPLRKCKICGGRRVKRLIGAGGAVIFRGTGFYATDYRKKEKPKPKTQTEPKLKDAKKVKK